MPNVNQMFPSKWLKHEDLQGREPIVVMDRVTMEEVGDEEPKPVLYFQGKKKGLVLNRTNANNISLLYGPDTESWRGKKIQLFTVWTEYRGQSKQGIRVKAPDNGEATQETQEPPAQQPPASSDFPGDRPGGTPVDLDDEIPF